MKPRIEFPYKPVSVSIKLPMLAKHYRPSKYDSPQECPIANAARDVFKATNAFSELDSTIIGKIKYMHLIYSKKHYDADMKRAISMAPDELVRTIKLTRVLEQNKPEKAIIHKQKQRRCKTQVSPDQKQKNQK